MVLEVKVSNGPEQSAPAPRRAGVVSARLPPGNPNRFSSGPVLQDYPTLIFLSPGGLIFVDLGDLQAVRAWEMGVIRAL